MIERWHHADILFSTVDSKGTYYLNFVRAETDFSGILFESYGIPAKQVKNLQTFVYEKGYEENFVIQYEGQNKVYEMPIC